MTAYTTDYAAMGLQAGYPFAPPKRVENSWGQKPAVSSELQKQRDRKNATYHRGVAERTASVIAFHPSQCNFAPVPTPSKTIHRGQGVHASI
jgi:hypothetical protein